MSNPPIAAKQKYEHTEHGVIRQDPYFWLKDRENPDVIEYLQQENAHTEAMTAHTAELREKLFEEIKNRTKQTDTSVPFKMGDWYYYHRTVDGQQYPINCRKASLDGEEIVILDENALAEGHEYLEVSDWEVNSGQDIMAYSVDTVGRRFYDIRFRNMVTGEEYPDVIPNATGALAWANDNSLFYGSQDTKTLRWDKIKRHVLGTPVEDDTVVFEERDDTFGCSVMLSKSKRYILVGSWQTLSTEYRFLEADNPEGELTIFEPRIREHEYELSHIGDHFYILTNWNARNFRLMRTPINAIGRENWEEVIPHREDVYLDDFKLFKDFLVLKERKEGLIHLRIKPWQGDGEHYLDFGEPAYVAFFSNNFDMDSQFLRYGYDSMRTQPSVYDYNMTTREKVLLKQVEVLGGYDLENYQTERVHATARDGVQVPISLVYRKDKRKKDGNPLYLYAYGSYGHNVDPSFRASYVSLLDRGFVFAIAHIRGGQVMGRHWYEDGKLLKKKNTFNDFIDCGKHLISTGYADSNNLFAGGGSAGGLLMGAVINQEPELFKGILSMVPFVDVMTTMLDKDIPLTTGEYDEWGDPNQKEYFDYMLSYSPYDNVEAKNYPNLLVTTGLHDSQVQFWEPAKWVARLRELKTDDNILLLKTNMDAGHGGASGRYERYKEVAFEFAFMLDLVGIKE